MKNTGWYDVSFFTFLFVIFLILWGLNISSNPNRSPLWAIAATLSLGFREILRRMDREGK